MEKRTKKKLIMDSLYYKGYSVKNLVELTDIEIDASLFVKIVSFTIGGTLSHILTDPANVEDYRTLLLMNETYYLLKF